MIANIMFGNEKTRSTVHPDLISAIKTGTPSINQFAGWDYKNPFPTNGTLRQHRNCSDSGLSGFEHIAYIADINGSWIAYITLFGQFRFTVWLGQSAGLAARSLAVNPRPSSLNRFEYNAGRPPSYIRRSESSFRDEFALNSKSIGTAFEAVLYQWQKEGAHANAESNATKLVERIKATGDDEAARINAIEKWAEEIAKLELVGAWKEKLDPKIIDDL